MTAKTGRETLEQAIEILTYLARTGPLTSREVAEHLGCWTIKAHALLSRLYIWNFIEGGRELHGPGTPDPQWVWRLTDDGRRFLKGFDELDERAPFATFENK